MQPDYEKLAKAKAALERGRVGEAAAHAIGEWDAMFRMMFRMDIGDVTPQRLERRYKKIPDAYRPRWGLIERLMDRRNKLSRDDSCDAGNIADLIDGMDAIIEQSSRAFRESGFD